jgi:hypothetical protein
MSNSLHPNPQRAKPQIGFIIFATAFLVLALLVGFVFSVAGAGPYGSAFSYTPNVPMRLRWLVIVLVSPLALACAAFKRKQLPKMTGVLLFASAVVCATIGQVDAFGLFLFWWWVYLLLVWAPMFFLACYLFSRKG